MITREKIKKAYNRHARDYDADSQLQRHLADRLARAIQADNTGYLKVLDVGCGTGHLMEQISPTRQILGCDFSSGMLNCAMDKAKSNLYIQADAAHLPFADSVFGLVVSNAAYQWVADLKVAFSEVKRVLVVDGRFYFTVFNKNTLWQLQGICRQAGNIRTASSWFPDRDKILSALDSAGFKVIAVETFCYEKYYKDFWELLNVLKRMGSNSSQNPDVPGLGWRKTLNRADCLYKARFGSQKGLPATFEAFLIKCNTGEYS